MNKREYANAIKTAIKAAVNQTGYIPTPGQRGAVIGIMNKVAGGDDNRKLILGWLFAEGELFDKLSTHNLTDQQWSALYAWVDFLKDEERIIWKPKPSFNQECLACLSASVDDYFKLKYKDRDDLPEPPDILSVAVQLGGEITQTGGNVGVKAPDSVFEMEGFVPIETPKSPYVSASVGKKIDTDDILEDLGFEKKALKPVFKTKPKLYNPFD
jgi:hypothetical protein